MESKGVERIRFLQLHSNWYNVDSIGILCFINIYRACFYTWYYVEQSLEIAYKICSKYHIGVIEQYSKTFLCVIPGNAHGFFLALYSEIILGGAQETIWDAIG